MPVMGGRRITPVPTHCISKAGAWDVGVVPSNMDFIFLKKGKEKDKKNGSEPYDKNVYIHIESRT